MTKRDPSCQGPHSPCEGAGILLAIYPFYPGATLLILAGAMRGVAWLVARQTTT